MDDRQRVITTNSELYSQYQTLTAGDIIVGRVRLRPGEESTLLDLVERGVQLIPAALAQLASRSKTLQVRLFSSFMVPHTMAVYTAHDLLQSISRYQKEDVRQVVTKHDRRNAGMGIHLWNSIEDVYSQASFGTIPFPFVIQPFCQHSRDIRVVVLGDYMEAYSRFNPFNFRHNLHCGGESKACDLTPAQLSLCRQVMTRGKFSYAHIDIMVAEDGAPFLAEINLRGGIRGAGINMADYADRIKGIHQNCLELAIKR